MSDDDEGLSVDAAEVSLLSDEYEAALMRNDLDAMNAAFWDSPAVLRFGISDMQFGFDDVVAWRRSATPVSADRWTITKTVLALAPGVVAVDLTFQNGHAPMLGRQSQTWVRRPEGWRIARAHVSVIQALRE